MVIYIFFEAKIEKKNVTHKDACCSTSVEASILKIYKGFFFLPSYAIVKSMRKRTINNEIFRIRIWLKRYESFTKEASSNANDCSFICPFLAYVASSSGLQNFLGLHTKIYTECIYVMSWLYEHASPRYVII